MTLNLLMDIDIDAEDVDINKLFKNAAEIGKASVTQKKFSLEVRREIEEATRKKMLAEQEANLQEVAKAQGMDEAQVDFWRRKFLGVGS